MPKIFIVGDLHLPYHNKRALRRIYAAIKKEKPTHIIQIGDLYDQYSFSRFTKKNITSSIKETKKARQNGLEFWNTARKIVPRSLCYQILGNHDIRLTKRIAEKVPEAYELVKEKLDELYTFKGVKTIYDDRHALKIMGIIFTHGYLSKLGDHMSYFGESCVVGHSHVGGCVYKQRNGKTIFELNAGYVGDETSEPMRYRPTAVSKWTLGYGLITFRGKVACPQFIPISKR